jgi:hypothetical protein|tara:strand:+ start:85 stop:240 length:156 start_codon:yes stop_codon:yes gene_type:complete
VEISSKNKIVTKYAFFSADDEFMYYVCIIQDAQSKLLSVTLKKEEEEETIN